jgi:uncharacterized protein YegP (UPF0339 family)
VAGSGETYARSDGRYAFRIKAANGQIVATDGNQGYENRSDAKATLTSVMAGVYKTFEVFARAGGLYAFRIKASNGQIVATDGGQGYSTHAAADATANAITRGEYNGPISDL